MPNTYFQGIPLKKAISTLANASKRFEICIEYNPEWIAENPNYNNWDVLYSTPRLSDAKKHLTKALLYASYYDEKCKNSTSLFFEEKNSKDVEYTILIRYQI